MRNILVIILVLCSSSTIAAEDIIPPWEAKINDNYCTAVLEMEIKIPNNPDSMFGRYIGFFLTVAIPHKGTKGKYINLFPPNERPFVLLFQAAPSIMIKKDKIKIIKDVSINAHGKEYKLVIDSDRTDPYLQTYYILGDKGYEVWKNIINGSNVYIFFSLSEDESFNIPVKGRYIRSVAKMFNACAEEMSHN